MGPSSRGIISSSRRRSFRCAAAALPVARERRKRFAGRATRTGIRLNDRWAPEPLRPTCQSVTTTAPKGHASPPERDAQRRQLGLPGLLPAKQGPPSQPVRNLKPGRCSLAHCRSPGERALAFLASHASARRRRRVDASRMHPSAAAPMGSKGPDATPAGFASRCITWCETTFPTVCTKVKDSFTYLTSKDYEKADGKTAEQMEASRNLRIKGFLSFSSLGFGAMCWGGATLVLEHVKRNHPKEASYCVMYLTFAFLCQLIGLISATFPSSSPWACFFAGLGAWQSAIFGLGLFHLNVMEYYESQKLAEYSMIGSSLLMSFYWSLGPQDLMFLHFLGKLLIGTLYILWIAFCWTLFLLVKASAFIVCFPFSVLSFVWRCKGNIGKCFGNGPGRQGLLPRLRWHNRKD